MLSAVSVGFFLILAGLLFISTPGLYDSLVKFFSDPWITGKVSGISLPLPQAGLQTYLDIFETARQFSVIWGVFLIALLGGRLILGSTVRRLAENAGDIVFWLGAAYLIQVLLVANSSLAGSADRQATASVEFWASIIALIGISLIVRAIFLFAARLRRS